MHQVSAATVQIPEQKITLTGYQIRLRELDSQDYPFMQKLLSDTLTMKHLMFMSHHEKGGWTMEDVIAKHSQQDQKKKSGNIQFIIEDQKTGESMGTCGFTSIRKDHFSGEFFVIIHHPYWGMGISMACHRLCLAYAFENLHLNRMGMTTLSANSGMRGFLQKLGVQEEGTIRGAFLQSGKFEDASTYSILKEEWPSVRAKLDQLMVHKRPH